MIEGSQMTIRFHVDDFNLSHVSTKVIENVISWLKREYESAFAEGSVQMMVSHGQTHKYLGMNID